MTRFIKIYFGVALCLFVILAFLANRYPMFPGDLEISRLVQSITFQPLIDLFTFLTNIGYPPVVNYWVVGLIVVLFVARQRRESVALFFLSALEASFFFSINKIVARHRPPSDIIHVVNRLGSFGFPSGHLMAYTMIFGFLIYLALKTRSPVLKALVIVPCALIISLIGVARIYSGEHWPSDIVGGYLMGSVGLILGIAFYRWTNRFSRT